MRYVMNHPGPGQEYAVGALMSTPARQPSATSNGVVRIIGYPGTMPVPTPRPAALPETAAGTRSNQPSYAAPNMMLPSIYYTTPHGMHPPVALLRTNPLPVPAVQIYNMPRISQRMRRVGGQTQIGQPQVAQSWPQWRGQG